MDPKDNLQPNPPTPVVEPPSPASPVEPVTPPVGEDTAPTKTPPPPPPPVMQMPVASPEPVTQQPNTDNVEASVAKDSQPVVDNTPPPSTPPPPPVMQMPVTETEDVDNEGDSVKKGISPMLWVVIVVLVIFVLVGGYFILQQTVFSDKGMDGSKAGGGLDIPPTATLAPQPSTDLDQVPTISEDSSLETIDAELNSLNASDPSTEINALNSEASQL